MFVTIHKDRYGRFDPFCEIFEKILDFNGIQHMRVDVNDADFWDNVRKSDLFIYRWIQWDDHLQIAKNIMPIIEYELKVKCLPDQATSWHYDDKIKQHYLLSLKGYPFIPTWVFYDRKRALEWMETEAEFPLVFKLTGGAASHSVALAKTKSMAKRMINKMFSTGVTSDRVSFGKTTRAVDFNIKKFVRHQGGNMLRRLRGEDAEAYWQLNKNYVMFQKFLPGNKFDTRIYVVGQRALAFRRMVRKNDFRASGSGNNDFNPEAIDKRCIQMALQVSAEMKFQTMAYDFLYDPDGNPMIAEISYASIDRVLYKCPGYWDRDLNFHEGNNWIQYFQLKDALNLPDLKQPDNIF